MLHKRARRKKKEAQDHISKLWYTENSAQRKIGTRSGSELSPEALQRPEGRGGEGERSIRSSCHVHRSSFLVPASVLLVPHFPKASEKLTRLADRPNFHPKHVPTSHYLSPKRRASEHSPVDGPIVVLWVNRWTTLGSLEQNLHNEKRDSQGMNILLEGGGRAWKWE